MVTDEAPSLRPCTGSPAGVWDYSCLPTSLPPRGCALRVFCGTAEVGCYPVLATPFILGADPSLAHVADLRPSACAHLRPRHAALIFEHGRFFIVPLDGCVSLCTVACHPRLHALLASESAQLRGERRVWWDTVLDQPPAISDFAFPSRSPLLSSPCILLGESDLVYFLDQGGSFELLEIDCIHTAP